MLFLDTKGFVMKHLLSPCKVGATSELPLPELLAPQGAAASPIVSENLMDLISLQPELSPSSFGGPEVSFDKVCILIDLTRQRRTSADVVPGVFYFRIPLVKS